MKRVPMTYKRNMIFRYSTLAPYRWEWGYWDPCGTFRCVRSFHPDLTLDECKAKLRDK